MSRGSDESCNENADGSALVRSEGDEGSSAGNSGVYLTGRCKNKLIAYKETWAHMGHGTGNQAPKKGRLPPGQRQVHDFPVLDLGLQPVVPLEEWRLTISGQVEVPTSWEWTTFLVQPQVTMISDIHCVTTWSRYDNVWQGVAARHLLSVVQPRRSARFVTFRSFDGYTTNVPLAAFADEDVLLAHSWQGKPLARAHGGPVRIVIPKLYFWKSAKWVQQIVFLDVDAPGYWEVRGYHNDGDPWQEERYGDPSPGERKSLSRLSRETAFGGVGERKCSNPT